MSDHRLKEFDAPRFGSGNVENNSSGLIGTVISDNKSDNGY
jgi:hypothetical protein